MELIPILSLAVLVGTTASLIIAVLAYLACTQRERRGKEDAARRNFAGSGETQMGAGERRPSGGWMQPPTITIVSEPAAEHDEPAAAHDEEEKQVAQRTTAPDAPGGESTETSLATDESDSATAAPGGHSKPSAAEASLPDLTKRAQNETPRQASAATDAPVPLSFSESASPDKDFAAPMIEPTELPTPPFFEAAFPSPGAGGQSAATVIFWEYTGEGFVPVDPAAAPASIPPARRSAAREDRGGDWL